MKVYNMTSPRTGKAVANQFIITDEDKTFFQSYSTTIAVFDAFDLTLDNEAEHYSKTTSKYLWKFLCTYYAANLRETTLKEFLKSGIYRRADLNA